MILRTDAKRVNAIRLEALADPSTVNGGTGRGSNGNFVLSEFEVDVASPDKPGDFDKVALANAEADYSQKDYHVALAIDGKIDRTGWAVDGNSKVENRTAMFVFRQPVRCESGAILRIRMIHKYGGSHHIARFRLAVHLSDDPPLATWSRTDPQQASGQTLAGGNRSIAGLVVRTVRHGGCPSGGRRMEGTRASARPNHQQHSGHDGHGRDGKHRERHTCCIEASTTSRGKRYSQARRKPFRPCPMIFPATGWDWRVG